MHFYCIVNSYIPHIFLLHCSVNIFIMPQIQLILLLLETIKPTSAHCKPPPFLDPAFLGSGIVYFLIPAIHNYLDIKTRPVSGS